MSGGDAGRCARHPDVAAEQTCDRCGDYYCRACVDSEHAGFCVKCAERLPHGIAWEDARAGLWPWRFVLTLKDVLVRPQLAFPGPARALPALAFAALTGLCFGLMLTSFGIALVLVDSALIAPMVALDRTGLLFGVGVGILLCTGAAVIVALAQTVSFAVGLRVVGRTRGLMRFAARASGYTQGLVLVFVSVPYVFAILAAVYPSSAFLEEARHLAWLTVAFLWPVASGRVWFAAARGLGLTSARAGVAAIGPLMLCTLPAAYISHLQLNL